MMMIFGFLILFLTVGERTQYNVIFDDGAKLEYDGDISLANIILNPHSPSLSTRIFGLPPSRDVAQAEFSTTYAISIISAALGLAKCLKNGVARPIAPGGTLDGLLTGRFLAAILASALMLVVKGACIGISLVIHQN